MKKILLVTGLMMAAMPGARAQGYVYVPNGPYGYAPGYTVSPGYGLYDAAPGYGGVELYGSYGDAPGYWYGDPSGNSVRQPSPRSSIRAVR